MITETEDDSTNFEEFLKLYEEHPRKQEIYDFVESKNDDFAEMLFGPDYKEEMIEKSEMVRSCWNSIDYDEQNKIHGYILKEFKEFMYKIRA